MQRTESALVTAPHPEVVRWVEYELWRKDKSFPFAPLEVWYVLRYHYTTPTSEASV